MLTVLLLQSQQLLASVEHSLQHTFQRKEIQDAIWHGYAAHGEVFLVLLRKELGIPPSPTQCEKASTPTGS